MATNKKYTVPFDPLWLDLIVELGKEGATPANIAAAIGMSETTLKKLIKERKNFAQAFELAMTHSKSFHEKALRDSYTNKDANSALIVALLRSVFPADYQTATQGGKRCVRLSICPVKRLLPQRVSVNEGRVWSKT